MNLSLSLCIDGGVGEGTVQCSVCAFLSYTRVRSSADFTSQNTSYARMMIGVVSSFRGCCMAGLILRF